MSKLKLIIFLPQRNSIMSVKNLATRKLSAQNPSHFILKSFRNIDTLPDILRLKPSQVTKHKDSQSNRQESQYVLLQMYLRSGWEEGIDKLLDSLGLGIKFHFDLNLQSLRNEDRAPSQILLPKKRRSKRKPMKNESVMDIEKGSKSSRIYSKKQNIVGITKVNTSEEIVSTILEDIIKNSVYNRNPSIPCFDQMFDIIPFCNQTMSVTALHLAILSQQSGTVKCIMNYILFNDDSNRHNVADTLSDVLSNEVEIDYHTDEFTKHEQALDGMNAFHLSCQYHPDSLHIIFEAISDYAKKSSNYHDICAALKSILQRKNRVMNTTPLHIAVKRSLVDAVR